MSRLLPRFFATALLAALLAPGCGGDGTAAAPDVVSWDVVSWDVVSSDVVSSDAVSSDAVSSDVERDAGGPPAVHDAGPGDAPVADAERDAGGPPAVHDAASDGDGGTGGRYPPAQPALIPLDGQVLCPTWFDGAAEPGWMVVDTGAIRTAVDEPLLREVENGVGLVTIDFDPQDGREGLRLPDYEVIAADLSKAVDHIGHPLAGLVGQDLFARLWFALDYRGPRVHVAAAAPAAAPEALGFSEDDRRALPYELVQGYPVVTVRVGDRDLRLIADTGSGVTLLTASSVDPAVLEGGVSGYVWHTSYGSDPGTIVRLPSLALTGVDVADSWAVVVPDEYHLKPIFDLVGIDVDGFLGYPVYRRFFIEIHGAERRYDLFPYPDLDHVAKDEWDRVGVEIRRDEGRVVVDMVFAPSDAAARGITPEDALLAIDGAPLEALGLDEIRRLLRGAPGETRTLTIEREGDAFDEAVAVDRLLPALP